MYLKRLLIISSLLSAFVLLSPLTTRAQQQIKGKVLDQETHKPLQSVSISAPRTRTYTNSLGEFNISVSPADSLTFSFVGYISKKVAPSNELIVELVPLASQLQEVQIVSTGYQRLPKERATGSFDLVDNTLLNRSVSTDILSRLEHLTPGLLFNHGDAAGTDPFIIRGRSTITANAEPLIVLDDFPYDGTISNINPSDIESVSILKDAAAASIWGARASNGVIVITTKRGRLGKPKIELNSNVTFQQKDDLYNINNMSSADAIELERYLFQQGRYNSALTGPYYNTPLTPVVELLVANPTDASSQIEAMKNHDVRDDLTKYMYRTSANQQYHLNISGAQEKMSYFLSGGFDKNLSGLVGEDYDRISVRSASTFNLHKQLKLNTVISYTKAQNRAGNNNGSESGASYPYYPYARLADDHGDPLPVYMDYRKGYIDTAGNGKLLDWSFKPVEDISQEEHLQKTRDMLFNAGAEYTIADGLKAELKYQFQNQMTNGSDYYKEGSYYARSNINRFTQIDQQSGRISYPMPMGGIMDLDNVEETSHQGRLQLNFNKRWNEKHELTVLGAYEIRSKVLESNSSRLYGYDPEYSALDPEIDYTTYYKLYSSAGTASVPAGQGISKSTDNFISYLFNGAYTYDSRYTLSGSLRKDEANLFGVKANQKGTPLWSLGAAWTLNNESFYNFAVLPLLKLRATYGVNGNVSRMASAYTTALFGTSTRTSLRLATIQTPPNENLRWERVKVLNLGMDFATKGNVLSGSVEYYDKHAIDLLAQAPTDPTLGITTFFGNVAAMRAKGWDIQLNSRNIEGKVNWQSTLIFSRSKQKVTDYLMPVSTSPAPYLPIGALSPIIGQPLYNVFSFVWRGLDPATGDPLGYRNGESSNDYNDIYFNTPLDSLINNGPVQPTIYGALRNTVSFKNLSLSFNISYKFGNYFRAQSVYYAGLLSGWGGHGDYALRWQKPGDELTTYVPSLVYPNDNSNRDEFYRYAQVLVHKADHIRLEDINLSYNVARGKNSRLPFSNLRLYLYASNLGVLWKANKAGIDPYYNNIAAEGRRLAIGGTFTF